jgi:hypothetical protein
MLCGAALISNESTALAQGTTVLHTGAGSPFLSGSQSLFIPASPSGVWVQLAVGFSTDEIVSPNAFFDSATLTLQNGSATSTAILFTTDCSGWYWSPAGGTAVIDPNAIDHSAIPFPDLTPIHAQQTAWVLNIPVPESMTGQTLNLYLDLFDNQNAIGSLAWMGPAYVIPEPSIFALAALGAAFALRRRFFGN